MIVGSSCIPATVSALVVLWVTVMPPVSKITKWVLSGNAPWLQFEVLARQSALASIQRLIRPVTSSRRVDPV